MTRLIVVMVLLALGARAQVVKLTFTDGREPVTVQVLGFNKVNLFAKGVNFSWKQIESATFLAFDETQRWLKEAFTEHRISTNVAGYKTENEDADVEVPPVVLSPVVRYAQAQESAKLMQIFGAAMFFGSVTLQHIYNKDYEREVKTNPRAVPKSVSPGFYISGGGIFVLGLCMDLASLRRLKQ